MRIAAAATMALLAALSRPQALLAQQTGTIRGVVTDSSTGRPVTSTIVTVQGTPRGTVTNDAGGYQIAGVPVGAASLRVQRIGYAAATRTVTVAAGASVTADFVLRPIATVVTTVVATGYGS